LLPLDEVLEGKVTSLDKRGVATIEYDFADEAQLRDFEDYRPFRVRGDWERKRRGAGVHLKGTGGIVWKPVFHKTLSLEYKVRLRRLRDVGSFIAENRPTEHYTMFSLFDQFFQIKDEGAGAAKKHMICRFLPPSKDFDGELVFRYVARSTSPKLSMSKPVSIRIGREGVDEWMEIDDSKLQGNENQWPALRGWRPGFYVLDSEAIFTDIKIKAAVDPAWAKAAGVDLKLPLTKHVPRSEDEGPSATDEADRMVIEAFKMGAGEGRDLLKIVENTERHPDVREEAAKALAESKDKTLVKPCITLLESEDLETRKYGELIVKKLAGRTFGFRAGDSPAKRSKGIQSLLAHMTKNPTKFQ
ncbi:MAG: HEAT repeat domain-containing protein, partial [Planctomycetota bacterium]